jgi:hypothetical protein
VDARTQMSLYQALPRYTTPNLESDPVDLAHTLRTPSGEPVLTKDHDGDGRREAMAQRAAWLVSAALLFYVFGYAHELEAADRSARARRRSALPAVRDGRPPRVLHGVGLAVRAALRRFVADVPIASVLAIRGGSELARAVSNPLADAAYAVGLMQLCGGRIDAVIASALIPGICHFFVMPRPDDDRAVAAAGRLRRRPW